MKILRTFENFFNEYDGKFRKYCKVKKGRLEIKNKYLAGALKEKFKALDEMRSEMVVSKGAYDEYDNHYQKLEQSVDERVKRAIVPIFDLDYLEGDYCNNTICYRLSGDISGSDKEINFIIPEKGRKAYIKKKLLRNGNYSKADERLIEVLADYVLSYARALDSFPVFRKKFGWGKGEFPTDTSAIEYVFREKHGRRIFCNILKKLEEEKVKKLLTFIANEDISIKKIFAYALMSVSKWDYAEIPNVAGDDDYYEDPIMGKICFFPMCLHGRATDVGKETQLFRLEIASAMLDFTKNNKKFSYTCLHRPHFLLGSMDRHIGESSLYGDIPIITKSGSKSERISSDSVKVRKLLDWMESRVIQGSLVFLASRPILRDEIFNVDISEVTRSPMDFYQVYETLMWHYVRFIQEGIRDQSAYVEFFSSREPDLDKDIAYEPYAEVRYKQLILAMERFCAFLKYEYAGCYDMGCAIKSVLAPVLLDEAIYREENAVRPAADIERKNILSDAEVEERFKRIMQLYMKKFRLSELPRGRDGKYLVVEPEFKILCQELFPKMKGHQYGHFLLRLNEAEIITKGKGNYSIRMINKEEKKCLVINRKFLFDGLENG